MPHLEIDSVVPATAADVPTLPPALQRRLRHVGAVKRMRSRVACAAGGILVASGAAFTLPAMAAPDTAVPAAPAPPPQELVVAAAPPIAAIARDSYTVVLPPPLQYPLTLGSAVASGYGPRVCSGCNSDFHHGIDIFPGAGTPVAAMASGVVSKASPSGQGDMGVLVAIDHVVAGEPVTSVYGHLQAGSMGLAVGDQVNVGDIIGRVGATGNAQGAHLHFEVHPDGSGSVNPYDWLGARI